ncbi:hypothetical protein [Haloterrigena alkaliphila]|uniref:Uncharacterized protein n=1 Tax=Haloterrigena alkaliphila TaxID=2816475 RepID=A0A8A2VGH6_9EURY|nr:hypothetical protein [Haloterrigena alkaliphila]QSW99495.1 hypothetical protein J0X25_00630 [Haloterrigena alkaliphila]
MSRATDAAGRAVWALLIAVLVSPALLPLGELLTSAGELTGVVVPNWVLVVVALAVGFVLEETYDGPEERLFHAALLIVILFVAFQWLVGLWGLNVISMRLLVADALVYLAAVSAGVALVFRTDLRERVATRTGGTDAEPRAE